MLAALITGRQRRQCRQGRRSIYRDRCICIFMTTVFLATVCVGYLRFDCVNWFSVWFYVIFVWYFCNMYKSWFLSAF